MYYYILNPSSGGGRINKIQDRLKSRLTELGIAGEFVKSIGEGDATKLAAMGVKKGFKTIVAVGGTGTINEVINGVGKNDIAVGIIPIGYKNELAKLLGISDWQNACNILAARKIDILDLGQVGKKYFITSVNIGFGAEITSTKPSDDSLFQKIKYYHHTLSWTSKFRPQKSKLNFNDDFMVETDFFNIQISNARFSENQPQDAGSNLLDVLITGKVSGLNSFKYIMDPEKLKPEKKPDISLFRAKRIAINTPKPMNVAIDGSIACKTPVVCQISNRQLKLIVARKKSSLKPGVKPEPPTKAKVKPTKK